MKDRFVKCNLLFLLIMLSACSEPVIYAPVKDVNQALSPDNGYVPETLPGPTEGFANKPENSRASEHKQGQTNKLALKPANIDKNGEHDAEFMPSTSSQAQKSKAELSKSTIKPAKSPTGSQIPKKIPQASENSNLNFGLSDRINAPKAVVNGEKNSDKKINNLYISSTNANNRDNYIKKHAKTLDKLEISEKNNKKPIISTDNKSVLKLNFQWPLHGRISKSFSQTDHKGIEIVGKIGQTVRAAEAGKTVYCGQGLAGFGNLAIIKHNDLYLSAYANNSKLIVKEGQQVGKGQAIGLLGKTGLNKASLHFEIRKNGKPINPLAVLPQN